MKRVGVVLGVVLLVAVVLLAGLYAVLNHSDWGFELMAKGIEAQLPANWDIMYIAREEGQEYARFDVVVSHPAFMYMEFDQLRNGLRVVWRWAKWASLHEGRLNIYLVSPDMYLGGWSGIVVINYDKPAGPLSTRNTLLYGMPMPEEYAKWPGR